MFLRRRNFLEEDEYVSRKIIQGVPEYSEFKIGYEYNEEFDHKKQIRLNRDILRFCMMRVFRPDLIIDQVKRFIEGFLDNSFTHVPVFNFAEIFRSTEHTVATLLVTKDSIDTYSEI